MNGTEEREDEEATDAAARDALEREARARARSYLDLWERHLVQTALHGPNLPWRPKRS